MTPGNWELPQGRAAELTADSQQRVVRHQPRHKTCLRCDGKKWFDSAIGLIACQSCDATGKGGIDVEWLVKDWQRLKAMEANAAMMPNNRISKPDDI